MKYEIAIKVGGVHLYITYLWDGHRMDIQTISVNGSADMMHNLNNAFMAKIEAKLNSKIKGVQNE